LILVDEEPEDMAGRQARLIWVAGAVAFAAWLAMLWLMFGDVL
jgi:hypothetical protein